MGREVKRVPLEFDWPMNKTWWGYIYRYEIEKETGYKMTCPTCHGNGRVPWQTASYQTPDDEGNYWCPHCEGERVPFFPNIEPPEGEAYQMWENTSEGSPISPVFATPEELARWLADNNASAFGHQGAPYEHWLGMIKGPGWAPSMVMHQSADGGTLMSGVTAMAGPLGGPCTEAVESSEDVFED